MDPTTFSSDLLGSEYAGMNEFLNLLDESNLFPTSVNSSNSGSASPTLGMKVLSQQPSLQPPKGDGGGSELSSPRPSTSRHVSDSARDKFFLTAADPTGPDLSPEERLKEVIHAKLEAGLLKPFNYVKGYARLQQFMDNK